MQLADYYISSFTACLQILSAEAAITAVSVAAYVELEDGIEVATPGVVAV